MNLPTPAFLALAATLTLQVGALLGLIFSDLPRKRLLIRLSSSPRYSMNR